MKNYNVIIIKVEDQENSPPYTIFINCFEDTYYLWKIDDFSQISYGPKKMSADQQVALDVLVTHELNRELGNTNEDYIHLEKIARQIGFFYKSAVVSEETKKCAKKAVDGLEKLDIPIIRQNVTSQVAIGKVSTEKWSEKNISLYEGAVYYKLRPLTRQLEVAKRNLSDDEKKKLKRSCFSECDKITSSEQMEDIQLMIKIFSGFYSHIESGESFFEQLSTEVYVKLIVAYCNAMIDQARFDAVEANQNGFVNIVEALNNLISSYQDQKSYFEQVLDKLGTFYPENTIESVSTMEKSKQLTLKNYPRSSNTENDGDR